MEFSLSTFGPQTALAELAYLGALVFARVGALMMLLPGFGEPGVPPRARLSFALLLTFLLAPLVAPLVPPLPASLGALAGMIVIEVAIGLALGTLARFFFAALTVTGHILSMQSGLAMAQTLDPAYGGQGSIFTGFLNVTALTLVFATELHHVFIAGVRGGYVLLPPGGGFAVGDFADFALTSFADAFALGVQLAAPLIVFGLVLYAGMGVLQKLMPQAQIFFITMPISVLVGLSLLAASLGTLMLVWLDKVEAFARQFV